MPDLYDFYVDVEDNGEIYYSFSTPDADYTVYFNPNEYTGQVGGYPLLLNNAYGFGFFQFVAEGVAIAQSDLKIRNTIEHILYCFYKEFPAAILLYHCYYADGKQGKRSKKFHRWHASSPGKDKIIKHEITLDILTGSRYVAHYIGLLCAADNKNIDLVLQEFERFALSFPDNKNV